MSATKLRDKIFNLTSQYLGTYTLNNGETTPAILCSDRSDPRNDRTCNGLEIIVLNIPTGKHPVFFKVWQRSSVLPHANVNKVIEILSQHLVLEDVEQIEIPEQIELRSILKATINAQAVFTFEDDFLD